MMLSSLDQTMRRLGLPESGMDKARGWIGQGTDKLVERALRDALAEGPDAALLEQAITLFQAHYDELNGDHVAPFHDVVATLETLTAAGVPMACVTNKRSRFARPLLKRLGWSSLFSVIVCGDDASLRKPLPRPLIDAAAGMGLPVKQVLMVGDSESDAGAARNAGMPLAMVPYGYRHTETVEELGPDYVIDTVAALMELFPVLSTYRPARRSQA